MSEDRQQALVDHWRAAPYPLFRRLLLYAARSGSIKASDLFATMSENPKRWLWSPEIQVELLLSLEWLWMNLDQHGQDSILELISNGPPREMFDPNLEIDSWERLRDHSVWERLTRLRHVAGSLHGPAASELSAIEERHPEWKPDGLQKEEVPSQRGLHWGSLTDFSADDLAEMKDEDLLRVITTHQQNRRGLIESWGETVQRDPGRGVRIMRALRAGGFEDPNVWSSGLSALDAASENVQLRGDLLTLLRDLPDSVVRGLLRSAADTVNKLSTTVDETVREELLAVWDRCVAIALDEETTDSEDRLVKAINSSIGVLAEALLAVLSAGNPKRDKGIPHDVQGRMELLIGSKQRASELSRVILSSRLPLLQSLDREWTNRNLVPFLNWADKSEAQGAWQGFLWSPRLGPSLWQDIKAYFLETFNHLELLERYRENLAHIFASVAIEGVDTLTPLETAECLRKLGDEGQAQVAFWIQRRLEGAGDQAGRLWLDRIGPWLEKVWPSEPALRGPKMSERLAFAVVMAKDSFASAVETLKRLAVPVEHGGFILHLMEDKGLVAEAPDACVKLISAITADTSPRIHDLHGFLEKVLKTKPEIENTPEFRRLQAIDLQSRA